MPGVLFFSPIHPTPTLYALLLRKSGRFVDTPGDMFNRVSQAGYSVESGLVKVMVSSHDPGGHLPFVEYDTCWMY